MKASVAKKISIIVTVLNEEKTIKLLLDSIETQTLNPNEVIIVDAGSTDKTVEIIKNHQKNSPLKFKLFVKKLSRSTARNFAIDQTESPIIAVTDAGNILKNDWLEKITKPLLESKAESVAGYYQTVSKTPFHQSMAFFVAVMPKKFNKHTYLPSSRSVAFTKTAWKKAGKYPEHLDFCEDLIFAQNLKSKTVMITQENALVDWIIDKTLPEFFTQIANYAQGDVEAHYQPHIRKIISQYIRYFLFIAIPPLFLIYIIWIFIKHFRIFEKFDGFFHTLILQITSDLAIIYGAAKGVFKKTGYI